MSIESNIKNRKQEFIWRETVKIQEYWKKNIFLEVINVNPKRKLEKGINATFVPMADLQQLEVLDDHHGISYELSKNFGLYQLDAEKTLVNVACKNNAKLRSFSDKIHEIIDNVPMGK